MFNNNLKCAREELGLTQKELGKIFNVSDSAVRAWENAYDSIPFIKLVGMCNLFNLSLDYIVGFSQRNTLYGNFEITKEVMGKKLKELRKSMNLSQQEFCDKSKISQTTYSGYETGHFLITTTNLYYICKTYNISMDYICGRTENKYLIKNT